MMDKLVIVCAVIAGLAAAWGIFSTWQFLRTVSPYIWVQTAWDRRWFLNAFWSYVGVVVFAVLGWVLS
jgi:hypothetical protein